MPDKLLSVIIPCCISEEDSSLFTLIEDNIHNFVNHHITFIYIDCGSNYREKELKALVGKNNIFLTPENPSCCISAAEARNYAVQHAKTDVIMFMDATDLADRDVFDKILRLVKIKNVAKDPNAFFGVPVIDVPEIGVKELLKLPREYWRSKLVEEIFCGYDMYKAQLRLASAALVMNRHKYLSLGGYRPECYGRAYEEFEFIHRLTTDTGAFPVRSSHYYYDSKSPSIATNYQYDGFRAQFSIIGREAMYNGIYLYNLALPYGRQSQSGNNLAKERTAAIKYFQVYDETHLGPTPLENRLTDNGHTLMIDMPYEKFGNNIKDIMPYLGKITYRKTDFFYENSEFSPTLLEAYLKNNKITRVMFSNPYGIKNRIPLYKYLRKINFPVLCFDRGALPDSWFFDIGFNYDSESYAESNWNKALETNEKDSVRQYIREVLNGENYLEAQNKRIGPAAMRRLLGLENEKILFAPLQKPDDTVIKYFAGNVENYENYLHELSELAKKLDNREWIVVCKKHPLAENIKLPNNLTVAPNGSNIMDLLNMADAVTVINSGTGLLAAMAGKPCYIWGEAFYQNNKINRQVRSWQDILKDIQNGFFKPNAEMVERLVSYLKNNLYSFGKSESVSSKTREGTIFRKTIAIDFWQIRLPGIKLDFKISSDNRFMPNGFAFELFREDINTRFKNWQDEIKKARATQAKPLPQSIKERPPVKNSTARKKTDSSEQPKCDAKPNVAEAQTSAEIVSSLRMKKQLLRDLNDGVFLKKACQKKSGLFERIFNRQPPVPRKLAEADLLKIMDTFQSKGIGAAYSLVDELTPHPHLQADAFTAIARSLSKTDKKQAAELAYDAWKLHPRPYRQKWLAFRLYDAGDVDSAILLLETLPKDTPLADAENRKIVAILAKKA